MIFLLAWQWVSEKRTTHQRNPNNTKNKHLGTLFSNRAQSDTLRIILDHFWASLVNVRVIFAFEALIKCWIKSCYFWWRQTLDYIFLLTLALMPPIKWNNTYVSCMKLKTKQNKIQHTHNRVVEIEKVKWRGQSR